MPRYIMRIELSGEINATSIEQAREITQEIARNIATGDVGHLSDHMIDETEALEPTLAENQEDD